MLFYHYYLIFFFFNDTATTEIYTLSLHDALPISASSERKSSGSRARLHGRASSGVPEPMMVTSNRSSRRSWSKIDRKSTRLNSSHLVISYAVFCLKKKNNIDRTLLFTPLSDHFLY